ncbi:hypothetical protein KAR91_77975 [Candidatus Pacearchaeota archaeon]|nr:hypothetical protein [Candidatus Pacearchaeota archaeon]
MSEQDQEQYREAFAEVVESFGKKLSPEEMTGVLGVVFEKYGVYLQSRTECEPGRDLDDPLIIG